MTRAAEHAAAEANAPEVSVIVCNFDGEHLLGRCLDHLLAQTHPSFEIIVVDDGSRDSSVEIAEIYVARDGVRLVRHPVNRGLSAARNAGADAARGRILAFIDNDGYAHPTWLEEGTRPFAAPDVGAVASLVLFNRNKCVVNGAGGTVNLRGYGGDFGFRRALEFVTLPAEVLYPMGCGMILRRAAWEAIAPLDPRILNYYDDVEVGIRVWNAGQRVVVCPRACIDHDYGSSSGVAPHKALLCERNRIRTMLKYGPKRHMLRWLRGESHLRGYLGMPGFRGIPLRAWGWNLRHLASALRIRRRLAVRPERYWGLVEPTWRPFPDPLPEDHFCGADPDGVTSKLVLDDAGSAAHFVHGWFGPEAIDGRLARWSAPEGAFLLRASGPVQALDLVLRGPAFGTRIGVTVRRFGEIEPLVRRPGLAVPPRWVRRSLPLDLGAGLYEVVVVADEPWRAVDDRPLGVALAHAEMLDGSP